MALYRVLVGRTVDLSGNPAGLCHLIDVHIGVPQKLLVGASYKQETEIIDLAHDQVYNRRHIVAGAPIDEDTEGSLGSTEMQNL
jgi:hypothetical protein